MKRAYIFLLIASLTLSFESSAFAYIDPNTGGFFFQTVAPFVYGILGVIVVFWKRISGFIRRIFGGKKDLHKSPQDD
jgi:hypothetical protein